MSDDLISRSALIQRFAYYHAHSYGKAEYAYGVAVEEALKAPTVDAVPVVHGRWITSSDIPDTLICSVCGRRYDMYHFDQKDMPFCLCGAKMDGGSE